MANSNSPYGFRLYGRLVPGTGTVAVTPGAAAGGTYSSSGPIPIASATALTIGDPIRVSAGLGYLCGVTGAIYGICNSPVPNFGETTTAKHYPEIIPADDQTIWQIQAKTGVIVSQGYIGVASKAYWMGGTTSGYKTIDLSHTTNGTLRVIGFAPGTTQKASCAELLVIINRGAFYGAS